MPKNNSDVQVSKDIYAIAKQEAEIEIAKLKQDVQASKEEGYSIGAIKANKAHRDYSNFLDALVLYKMKKSKDYRKAGLTWEKFCEEAGYARRTAEEIIDQVTPIFESFSANLPVLAGVNLNDIRWLGKNKPADFAGLSEDGKELIFGDDKIPATPEDITSYIKNLKENYTKEKEETEATLRTKERLLKDKEQTINKMEKEIMRLERTVPKAELTEEEQEGVDLLFQIQKDFLSAISDIKKKIIPHKAPDVVLRQQYFLYIFIAKVVMEERMKLHEEYQDAEEVPWEISEMELPPTDVMIDNLPMTAGKGLGKKVVAKMEERNAPKSKK
ncbi:MAG: hypothetical protein ABFD76_10620 [Smithella sp.]